MAIDMIEDNELGALSVSRLGMKNFIDDNWVYKDNRGVKTYATNEEFANLFGSKKREKNASEVKAKFASLKTDCANVNKSISILENEVDGLARGLASAKKDTLLQVELQAVRGELTRVKSAKIANKCQEEEDKLAAAEEEKKNAEALAKLKEITEGAISGTKGDLAPDGSENTGMSTTKKVLIFGGVGLVVLIGTIFLIRRGKK